MIFKSKQADNLEQAFKEFTAKKLKQQERPSIRKTLAVLKEKAAARSSQQAKEKIKERGCHDEAGNEKADHRQPALPAVCLPVRQAGTDLPAGGWGGLVGKAIAPCGRFSLAFESAAPSFHLFDLAVGVAGAVALRLMVYCKSKNAKKYRRGVEYGSARWAAPKI